MIGKLRGLLDTVYDDHIILDVHGVGYKIFTSQKTIQKISLYEGEVSLIIDTQIREDDISFYGFLSDLEKSWFTKLISVKGISPRIALLIFSAMTVSQLESAIISADKKAFSEIPGVGKKISERIITELKDTKNLGLSTNTKTASPSNNSSNITENNNLVNDATSALVNLGYQHNQAYLICNKIFLDNPDIGVGSLIKMSLKEITK